jgi:hypothetical protein
MLLIMCQATYLLLPLSPALDSEYDESECPWTFPETRSQDAGMHPLGRIGELDVNLFSFS